MKVKTLKILFESWDSFRDRTKKELNVAAKGKNNFVQPDDVLVFDTVASYQRLMSEPKYIILAAIKNLKPGSIYQLAKMVDRDFANVLKDCEILEGAGFITLEDTGDNRKTKQPQLTFAYNAIEVHLPNMVYSHHLGKTAA